MNKLLLCCGPIKLAGYKTLDCDPRWEPDYVMTLPQEFPNRHERWDEIALFHGIEHFFLWEAEDLLWECHQALVLGGTLILEQPNIEFAAKVLLGIEKPLTGTVGQSDMWPLYGDPSHKNPLYGHKWGWTPATLTEALVAAGFDARKVQRTRPQYHLGEPRDFRLEAVK